METRGNKVMSESSPGASGMPPHAGEAGWHRSEVRRPPLGSAIFFSILFFHLAVLSFSAPLRVMTFNITKFGTYVEEPATSILQGLEPDVVMLQEWILDDQGPWGEDYRAWIDEAFGPEFDYYRGLGQGGGASNVNGIVSRYRILDSGSWDDVVIPQPQRYFDWAIIDLPGATDLQVVSIHLKAGDTQEERDKRVTEANNLKTLIEANFDANEYIVVCGDMNTRTRTSEPDLIAVFDSFLTTSDGTPVDRNGDNNTNLNRDSAYDWIIPNQLLRAVITPLDLGSSSGPYPGGIVFDSRVFDPLSAVVPVQSGDTASGAMDHCPAMKAYDVLPAPTPTPSSEWPMKLNVNKTRFSTTDHISVTADFPPTLTPFFPYIRLSAPDGTHIYITRRNDHRSRLSVNAPAPFREGGPYVIDFTLDAYPVLDASFSVSQKGTWTLQGAFIDVYRNILGEIKEVQLRVL